MRRVSTHQPDALYCEISSHREVRDLASQILSRDRGYPVIALTARPGEHEPALSVKRIREIVGPDVPIYFLSSYSFSLRLSYLLPRCLSVSGGAGRLWWPGVDKDSRPQDHPKFYSRPGNYQDMVYEWLESELRPSPTPPLKLTGPPPPLVHTARPGKQPDTGLGLDARIMSGMKILSQFASSQTTMGHRELAARLNLSRSCAHRCLVELTLLGYLVETRERRFRLVGGTQRDYLLEIITD